MGWDICSAGKHDLHFTGIEELAKELSTRFSINIVYGYWASEVYDPVGRVVRPDDRGFTELGRALVDDGPVCYRLEDGIRCQKDILRATGGDLKGVRWEGYCYPEMVDEPQEYCLDLLDDAPEDNPCDIFWIDVYKEACTVNLRSEPFRWKGFYYNFYENPPWKDLDMLNGFRRRMMEAYGKLGVRKIYYYSDQGATQLNDDLLGATWEEMERYILEKRCFDDIHDEDYKRWKKDARLIDIPAFMTGRDPRFSECLSDTFVDDFSDLKGQ